MFHGPWLFKQVLHEGRVESAVVNEDSKAGICAAANEQYAAFIADRANSAALDYSSELELIDRVEGWLCDPERDTESTIAVANSDLGSVPVNDVTLDQYRLGLHDAALAALEVLAAKYGVAA